MAVRTSRLQATPPDISFPREMTPGDPNRSSAAGDDEPEPPPKPDVGVASLPSLEAILRPLPSDRARGRWPDTVQFYIRRAVQMILHRLPGREATRPHPKLLAAAIQEVLRSYRDPVCLEVEGGRATDRTEATVTLASVLRGQGRLLSLAEDEKTLEDRRDACGSLSQWVEFVAGDPADTIQRLRREGDLEHVHLAFLHTADDPGRARRGLGALEELIVPGGLLMVDGVVQPAASAGEVGSRLRDGPDWSVRMVHAAAGILVAQRTG